MHFFTFKSFIWPQGNCYFLEIGSERALISSLVFEPELLTDTLLRHPKICVDSEHLLTDALDDKYAKMGEIGRHSRCVLCASADNQNKEI